jgi:hypothetical protein
MRAARTRTAFVVIVLAGVAGLLLGSASAVAGASFTWAGIDSSANWSTAHNWVGGAAPSVVDSGDSLIFPAPLTGGDCTTTQTDACYLPQDDLSGYAISGLAIDDGTGYDLTGSDPLSIGAGGISASTTSDASDASSIAVPLSLNAPQSWEIDGGSGGMGELKVTGGITGNGNALSVGVQRGGVLELGGSNTLSSLNVTGSNPVDTGSAALGNGALVLRGTLNTAGNSTADITDAGLLGGGNLDNVNVVGGLVDPGPDGGSIDASTVNLDAQSVLRLELGVSNGEMIPATQLSGSVDASGATLELTGASGDACPVLPIGGTATIISGPVTGRFAGIPDGAVVPLDCDSQSPPEVEIKYENNYVEALVPSSVTLASSATSTSVGGEVTLSSMIDNGLPPDGTVEFESDGTAIAGCGAVAPNEGSPGDAAANCTATFSGGVHVVEAVFNAGDAYTASGKSPPVTLSVARLPTQLIVHSGTVSATVRPSAIVYAVVPQPSGTVEFLQYGVPIPDCTAVALVPVVDGNPSANCEASSNLSGVSAIYAGDVDWLGSSTPAVTAPATALAFSDLHTKGDRLSLEVNCLPAGSAITIVDLTLTTTQSARAAKKTATLKVGSGTVGIGPGGSASATIKLNKVGARLLAKRHILRTTLRGTIVMSTTAHASAPTAVVFRKR